MHWPQKASAAPAARAADDRTPSVQPSAQASNGRFSLFEQGFEGFFMKAQKLFVGFSGSLRVFIGVE